MDVLISESVQGRYYNHNLGLKHTRTLEANSPKPDQVLLRAKTQSEEVTHLPGRLQLLLRLLCRLVHIDDQMRRQELTDADALYLIVVVHT